MTARGARPEARIEDWAGSSADGRSAIRLPDPLDRLITEKAFHRTTKERKKMTLNGDQQTLVSIAAEAWYEQDDFNDEDSGSVVEYELTSSPNDFNVKTIYDFIVSGSVAIPGFQRNYVWDIRRASKLIESLIIGLPIPQVFLYEESRNKFLVIDGQQRLMSIYYFIRQRFPKMEKRAEIRRIFDQHAGIPETLLQDDAYFTKFNLYLPGKPNKLHNLNYATLDEFKTTLDLRTIRNVIIKQTMPSDDDSSVYEIFNRLNTGGVNLTPQEIRMSLYHSDFYSMLYRINADGRWRGLLGVRDPDLHMKDIEILLRGFAMLFHGDDYKPSMVRFLGRFSKKAKQFPPEAVQYAEDIFKGFLAASAKLQPSSFHGKAGRKFNLSMFEAIFTAACGAAFKARSVEVPEISPESVLALKSDVEFVDATQSRTADASIVRKRLGKAREYLAG